jgi:hypothetical protein
VGKSRAKRRAAAARIEQRQVVGAGRQPRRRVPSNVSVRRVEPGKYSVHVNATVILWDVRSLAGHVRRDPLTHLWAVNDGLAVHPDQDAAVIALLEEKLTP